MRGAEYSAEAAEDLLRLADLVSDRSIDGAFRLVDEIDAAVQRLREFPELGHRHEHIPDERVRVTAVRQWLVAYRLTPGMVVVSRIVSGLSDLSRLYLP